MSIEGTEWSPAIWQRFRKYEYMYIYSYMRDGLMI